MIKAELDKTNQPNTTHTHKTKTKTATTNRRVPGGLWVESQRELKSVEL